jgi:putative transposase
MSFELVQAQEAHFPKALMCRTLGLSRSGYHAWCTRPPSERDHARQQLDVQVKATFDEHDGHYGAPRVEQHLRRQGVRTSRKRIAASLVRQGLVARPKRRWRTTTDSNHKEPIAPNLLQRKFSAADTNQAWVADTTYLSVLTGFIFLVVIIDLFSRKVVGWAVGKHLDADLSGLALKRAVARRQPPPGLIFHSDRGSEFAAASFREELKNIGAIQSMSRKGNCWDNAVAESFFSTLEFEGPSTTTWRDVDAAEPALFRFIEAYYNTTRLHSYNDYRSPIEAETAHRNLAVPA